MACRNIAISIVAFGLLNLIIAAKLERRYSQYNNRRITQYYNGRNSQYYKGLTQYYNADTNRYHRYIGEANNRYYNDDSDQYYNSDNNDVSDGKKYYNSVIVEPYEKPDYNYNNDYPKLNKVLRTFNVNLIRSVDHKLESLTDNQRARFHEDVLDMNAAITDEYNRIKYKRRFRSDDDGTSKEIGGAVIEKIITDYQSKPWYKGIKRFTGAGRFKSLIRDLVYNLAE